MREPYGQSVQQLTHHTRLLVVNATDINCAIWILVQSDITWTLYLEAGRLTGHLLFHMQLCWVRKAEIFWLFVKVCWHNGFYLLLMIESWSSNQVYSILLWFYHWKKYNSLDRSLRKAYVTVQTIHSWSVSRMIRFLPVHSILTKPSVSTWRRVTGS